MSHHGYPPTPHYLRSLGYIREWSHQFGKLPPIAGVSPFRLRSAQCQR